MADNYTRVALRYEIEGFSSEYLIDNNGKGFSSEEAASMLGVLLYEKRIQNQKLRFVRIVPFRKKAGTKSLFEMSRDIMPEERLRYWCKYFFQKAYVPAM